MQLTGKLLRSREFAIIVLKVKDCLNLTLAVQSPLSLASILCPLLAYCVMLLHADCSHAFGNKLLPSQQLASSAGLGAIVLQSGEAVSCQSAVTLFPESVVAHCVPLRQLAGVAPRHQCMLQHRVPLFVPQEHLAPLLARNLWRRIRRWESRMAPNKTRPGIPF